MYPKVEIRPGTLKGMEREVVCLVNFSIGDHSHASTATVQNADDLPEGEYIFTYKSGSSGSIPLIKHGRMWLTKE
jgi:hypothetical protein